jgi:hypothetical protein
MIDGHGGVCVALWLKESQGVRHVNIVGKG